MPPPPLDLHHANGSEYTLRTVHYEDAPDTPTTPLLDITPAPAYGATPRSPTQPSTRRLLVNAALKMSAIFVISTLVLGGTLWLALPTLEE